MNPVNNRSLIEPLLVFPSDDIFYFVQILQRKKDVAIKGTNNSSRLIKAYHITSLEKLDEKFDEMVKLAELFTARVVINLNPRSFEKAAYSMLIKLANQVKDKDFRGAATAYNSICGEYHKIEDKRWILDLDADMHNTNITFETFDEKVAGVKKLVSELQSQNDGRYQILAEIPSKTGMHLITNPFDLSKFIKEFCDISIIKNGPTNLYIP